MATSTELPPPIHIHPPLLNSANPWATTLEDLRALYECPSTGAVTTRTALLRGFPHDPAVHQYAFFDPATHRASPASAGPAAAGHSASLNNLGYSPVPLKEYLLYILAVVAGTWDEDNNNKRERKKKPFIVSVTGSPADVAECYAEVARTAAEQEQRAPGSLALAIEVNLSCPNIAGAPPPAYDGAALGAYLDAVAAAAADNNKTAKRRVPWGVKTPPYTHAGQFAMLGDALARCAAGREGGCCPLSFVTATNTLGSCLVLQGAEGTAAKGLESALAGTGVGGMAGAALHPLALGNVRALRELLDAAPETRHVAVIGVGGVEDADGYRRMRSVGAAAVGVGTALGRKGVGVFEEIEQGLGKRGWEG
ncbi:hypothetical protein GGR52DRAFT_296209 [Hypoxylon sp. FL1284]|nr:hypothetical protein GGR52DRAFT_296209 [Hypoxylon sp. FL1284]